MNKTNKTICFCIIFLILILIIIYLQKKKKEKKSIGSWLTGAVNTVADQAVIAGNAFASGATQLWKSPAGDDLRLFGINVVAEFKTLSGEVFDLNHSLTPGASNKTMDYKSSKIFGTKYQWYTPQGFAIGTIKGIEYCYLAAYHLTGSCGNHWEKEHTEPSKVFKIKLSDKTLVKVYNLVDQSLGSHVGGMSVIEETNQFFIASKKKSGSVGTDGICLYSMDAADQDSKEEVDVTATKEYKYTTYCPDTACLGSKAPSYMFFDKRNSLLWYGRYSRHDGPTTTANPYGEPYPGNICSNPVTISGGSAKLELNKPENTLPLPFGEIQGMAIVQTTSLLIIYLTHSSSAIFRWIPAIGEFGMFAQGPGGLQNLDFDSNNQLWGVSEGGSKYYQSTLLSCGGKNPWPIQGGMIYADISVPPIPEKWALNVPSPCDQKNAGYTPFNGNMSCLTKASTNFNSIFDSGDLFSLKMKQYIEQKDTSLPVDGQIVGIALTPLGVTFYRRNDDSSLFQVLQTWENKRTLRDDTVKLKIYKSGRIRLDGGVDNASQENITLTNIGDHSAWDTSNVPVGTDAYRIDSDSRCPYIYMRPKGWDGYPTTPAGKKNRFNILGNDVC